jgi:L-lactate dehydrogenase (cytochrome)
MATKLPDLPIAVKDIQCWQDAALCMQYGVYPRPSNHGGRQFDGAPSTLETLLEIRTRHPEVFERCEVLVDDVLKALALSAKGVGLGKAFLHALVLGQYEISKAIAILKHQVETTMALLGVSSVIYVCPSFFYNRI